MKNFTKFCSMFEGYKIVRNRGQSVDVYGKNIKMSFNDKEEHGKAFVENIDESLSQSKIFVIGDCIKKLLALTKVPEKNDKIYLPFPYVFLDVDFDRKDMLKLGIDIGYDRIVGIMFSKGVLMLTNTTIPVASDLRITIASVNANGHVQFDTFNFGCNVDDKYSDFDFDFEVVECDDTNPHAKRFIHLFVLAFLNFYHNPEVKFIEVSRSDGQNAKRIAKGKLPIPSMYGIRLDGVLKKYVDSLEGSGCFEYHYRFFVRGHFRTLRDEKRWGSNVGKRIFIPPFIKGKGVLIEKEYVLESKDNNL